MEKDMRPRNWLLQGGKCLIGNEIKTGDLYIKGGKIKQFIEAKTPSVPWLEEDNYFTMDCTNTLIGPGFIDLHVHGGGGADVMDATFSSYDQLAYSHGQHGTTRFLMTTITASHEDLLHVCRTAKEWSENIHLPKAQNKNREAKPLGIHLEGPYIAQAKKGAQNEEYIRPFSMEEFK